MISRVIMTAILAVGLGGASAVDVFARSKTENQPQSTAPNPCTKQAGGRERCTMCCAKQKADDVWKASCQARCS